MLTNNEILKKLRVALQLNHDDIIAILELVDFKITKGALGDLFRAEDHANYVEAGDQILRNFLNGLVIYKRGPIEQKPLSENKIKSNKYEPNIIPKIEQKKQQSTYKPFTPKDKKSETRGGNNTNKFGATYPKKNTKQSPSIPKNIIPKAMAKERESKREDGGSKLGRSVFKKDHFQK